MLEPRYALRTYVIPVIRFAPANQQVAVLQLGIQLLCK